MMKVRQEKFKLYARESFVSCDGLASEKIL